jgi:uncharacterized protein (DUF952 family)
MFIYHITSQKLWEEQQPTGFYTPFGYANDGFIHCSTVSQVHPVSLRFYRGQKDLIVLEIDPSRYGALLAFENLEGGMELFPHLYAPLETESVHQIYELPLGVNGDFIFPELFRQPQG